MDVDYYVITVFLVDSNHIVVNIHMAYVSKCISQRIFLTYYDYVLIHCALRTHNQSAFKTGLKNVNNYSRSVSLFFSYFHLYPPSCLPLFLPFRCMRHYLLSYCHNAVQELVSSIVLSAQYSYHATSCLSAASSSRKVLFTPISIALIPTHFSQ